MQKIITIAALLLALAFALGACGATEFKHTYAWIFLDGQTIAEGPVDHWTNLGGNGMVVLVIDGKRYRTHYSNAVIVEYPEGSQVKETEARPC